MLWSSLVPSLKLRQDCLPFVELEALDQTNFILEQEGRLGSGSPGTRHSESGQHKLQSNLRGLVGMILGLANP